MEDERRVSAKAATNERTPAWVLLVVALWSLTLVAFLLIAFGPPAG
jgi:hypothetical protein